MLEERLPINAGELDNLVDELIAEMTGLGPIEPLLKDPIIADILINTHKDCYIERFGALERVPRIEYSTMEAPRSSRRRRAAIGANAPSTAAGPTG